MINSMIRMNSFLCIICISTIATLAEANGQTHNVATGDEFEALMESGTLAAGDTIIWADGIARDVELDIVGIDGTKTQPITLRSATPGGVVLRGESQFKVGSRWWVIQGFHFDGEDDDVNAYNTFQFRSNNGTPAQHVRLTQCAFTDLKFDDETSKWILIYGRSNSIDHCHFSGKNSKGALMTVELGYLHADTTANHKISHNYFGDVAPQDGSDNETIRIGASQDQSKPARCIVRENYFVRCNGEPEIISSKSSFNVFEKNTFRQCDGSLVLRHGHHSRVDGNYFFGDGAQDAGGIRVCDSHHVIVNNYLQGLTGTTWNAAFSILGGRQTSGGTDNGYQAVDGIHVSHNSIFNCQRSIFLNKAKGSRPPTGVIANNLISSLTGPLVTAELSSMKLEWIGNLMHGAPIGIEIDAATADPKLSNIDGLLRPDAAGSAAQAAVVIGQNVVVDIDGQKRPESGADIGADEVSGAIGEISSRPLIPADVGVSFLRGSGPQQR